MENSAERFENAVRADGRYPPEAYEFLHRGLEYTTQQAFGGEVPSGAQHVSGRQLCEGLRDLALRSWGPLAKPVLSRWGIHSTRDFGEMVFFLIGLGMLGKQDEDRIEDFDGVYDFDEALSAYEIPLDKLD